MRFLRHTENHAYFEEVIGEEISRDLFQSQGLGHNKPGTLCTPATAELPLHVLSFSGSMHPGQFVVEKRTLLRERTFFHDLSSLLPALLPPVVHLTSTTVKYRFYRGKGKVQRLPFHAFSWSAVKGSFGIYQEELLQTTSTLQKMSLLQGKSSNFMQNAMHFNGLICILNCWRIDGKVVKLCRKVLFLTNFVRNRAGVAALFRILQAQW